MSDRPLDLVREVLDHELLDPDGRPCGMVDDIELAGKPGAALRVVGIVVGPPVWGARLPFGLGRAVRAVFGKRLVRVPWQEVRLQGDRLHLRQPARALGLGSAERRFGRWIARLPGA
jgi:hypothetical protein